MEVEQFRRFLFVIEDFLQPQLLWLSSQVTEKLTKTTKTQSNTAMPQWGDLFWNVQHWDRVCISQIPA
jgi:hypothetical protein